MTPATLFGGARDGFELTVMDPIPEKLSFPALVTPVPEDWQQAQITSVTYHLRSKQRCCATWCTWPRPCTCCPRCLTARLIYDLERQR